MKNEKMFVIVRRDLTPSQQAVQAGHAVAEYLIHCPKMGWNNGTLIYLGVKNKEELEKWIYRLLLEEAPFASFIEDDMNHERTAIASVYNESFFKNLQVL